MKGKRVIALMAVLMAAGLVFTPLLSGPAQAENFRLTIGSGHPTSAVWVARVQDFFAVEVKKRVAERTKHTIEWNNALGGSVCKLGECLEASQAGLVDVAVIIIPLEPTKLGLHNFGYYTPFNTPDQTLAIKTGLEIFDKVPYLKEVFEKKYNQKYCGGLAASDSYHLLTKFPWKTVDDLKGKKIAAVGPNLTYIKAINAVPVQSNLNEAYTSLQTGVYDGWVMFVDATVGFKLYEVAKYYTFTDFGCCFGSVVTVNLDKWKTLPKEVQDIMLEVGREYSLDESKAALAKAQAGVDLMKKAGVEFTQLSFEQKQRWANMMPNIPLEMAKKFDAQGEPGTEVFASFLDTLEKAGFKFPRRWEVK